MRKHFLDNIRWVTVLLVLVYHVFYMYNSVGVLGGIGGFNKVQYQDSLLSFVYPWFMALLFLIAGISSRYSLNNHTNKEFIKNKTAKLLVPSTLGLFVYHFAAGYLNVKFGGGLSQLPKALVYPISVMSGVGPLWFIQLLYVYSLLLVLIRKIDSKDKLYHLGEKCNIIILLLLLFPVWGAAQILNAPVITTYRFGIYFMVYLLGYFVFSHDKVQETLKTYHLPLLIAALLMGIGYTVYYFGANYVEDAILRGAFTNIYLWFAILAILGCGKAWFDKTSKFATYMAKSSFEIYVVHYLWILVVCYCLKTYMALPVFLKYILAIILVFIISTAVYELLRRIPVIRFLLFGLKKKKEDSKQI